MRVETHQLSSRDREIKKRLDGLVRSYGLKDLGNDPLLFPRRFRDPADQEIVGFLAAALAYGNVLQIRASVEGALARIAATGKTPRAFVERFDPRRDAKRFYGFVHRFNRGEDLAALFYLLRQAIRASGSLEAFFVCGKQEPTSLPLRDLLASFVLRIEALDPGPSYGGRWPLSGEGVRFFFSSPANGSACKRLCMFLRWMVRRGAPDLGIWRSIAPAQLVMPIDTHIARIAHRLKLIHLSNATWKIAEGLTENLRRFEPEDPVRYDFALSRVGILEGWPRKRPRRASAQHILELCEGSR